LHISRITTKTYISPSRHADSCRTSIDQACNGVINIAHFRGDLAGKPKYREALHCDILIMITIEQITAPDEAMVSADIDVDALSTMRKLQCLPRKRHRSRRFPPAPPYLGTIAVLSVTVLLPVFTSAAQRQLTRCTQSSSMITTPANRLLYSILAKR
jgi:hypothetical protein